MTLFIQGKSDPPTHTTRLDTQMPQDEYGINHLNLPNSRMIDNRLTFCGLDWKTAYRNGNILINSNEAMVIESKTNTHSFIETTISDIPASVQVDVFTGSDQGDAWGPGLAIIFSSESVKINVRYRAGFTASLNGKEFNSRLQSSEPNRWYTLRIKLNGDLIVTEVTDKTAANGKWTKVMEFSVPNINKTIQAIRIGKMDIRGGAYDDQNDQGKVNNCQFANLLISSGS